MEQDINHPDNEDVITAWVTAYYLGYEKFMQKHHLQLYSKFYMNINPPQKIGGCIGIMQGAIHSDEDYKEIMSITHDFCVKYENPQDFPKEF